jgi:hypothetical protein
MRKAMRGRIALQSFTKKMNLRRFQRVNSSITPDLVYGATRGRLAIEARDECSPEEPQRAVAKSNWDSRRFTATMLREEVENPDP